MFLGADIEDLFANGNGPNVRSSQVVATMIVAIEPATLNVATKDAKARPLLDCFAAGLSANPDLMMAVFQKVRSKWHNPNPSHADVVRKFIASNIWFPIIRDNGKIKLGLLTKSVSDEEIRRAIKLGTKRSIEIETLKSARQDWRFPKRNINQSEELHAALKYLRTLGFCQYW